MKYVCKRILMLLVTMVIVSLLAFAAFELIHGSAAEIMLGTQATPERVAELEAELGLDRPFAVRYLEWLAGFFTYKLRNIRIKGLAVAASLPPVLFNAVIIGIEIAVMFPDPTSSAPIWLACITNGISVGIGELISCTVLGVLLVKIIESSKALRKIFAA